MEQSPLKVVEASPRPPRARRRLLPIALRLISVVGLVSSGIGAWSLLHADATPSSKTSSEPRSLAAGPSPAVIASPAATPTASPVPTSPPDEWASWPTCSNAAFGYQISYPPDWYTAEPNDQLGCRFFDRSSFTVTRDSPLPTTEMRIYLSTHTFADEDLRYRKSSASWLIRRSPAHVDGHRAFTVEIRTSTGMAFATVIDLGGDALLIETSSDYDQDFASSMSYVMLMSSSLIFSSA